MSGGKLPLKSRQLCDLLRNRVKEWGYPCTAARLHPYHDQIELLFELPKNRVGVYCVDAQVLVLGGENYKAFEEFLHREINYCMVDWKIKIGTGPTAQVLYAKKNPTPPEITPEEWGEVAP